MLTKSGFNCSTVSTYIYVGIRPVVIHTIVQEHWQTKEDHDHNIEIWKSEGRNEEKEKKKILVLNVIIWYGKNQKEGYKNHCYWYLIWAYTSNSKSAKMSMFSFLIRDVMDDAIEDVPILTDYQPHQRRWVCRISFKMKVRITILSGVANCDTNRLLLAFGGSWADTDVDLASISVPIEKPYGHHDGYSRGGGYHENSSLGPPYIVKLVNLPVTANDAFVQDL